MPSTSVTITTPAGRCPATLHTADTPFPRPAVIMYPDAGGVREAFHAMAQTLADFSYTVLLPDLYYRYGAWRPFDMSTVWTNDAERERLMAMAASLAPEMLASDASVFADFLGQDSRVSESEIGVCGYCGGGRAAFIVGGRLPDRIIAVAAIHPGGLVTDADDSAHLLASQMATSTVYIGRAHNDPLFTSQNADVLDRALSDAHVSHTIETYSAAHGFAVADGAHYDADAAKQHWTALKRLFDNALPVGPLGRKTQRTPLFDR